MHSYVFKMVEADKDIDAQASHNWMNTGISSDVEGYVTTLQEQAVATRATIKCRNKDNNETKCRLCKSQEETVFHVRVKLLIAIFKPIPWLDFRELLKGL